MNQIHCIGSKMYRPAGFLLLFIFLVGFANAQGQQRMSPEEQQERYEKQLAELVVTLELTEGQTPPFQEIMEASFADRIDLIDNMRTGGDRSTLRAQMLILNEETDVALAEILTHEQVEKYKKLRAERVSRRRQPES